MTIQQYADFKEKTAAQIMAHVAGCWPGKVFNENSPLNADEQIVIEYILSL